MSDFEKAIAKRRMAIVQLQELSETAKRAAEAVSETLPVFAVLARELAALADMHRRVLEQGGKVEEGEVPEKIEIEP